MTGDQPRLLNWPRFSQPGKVKALVTLATSYNGAEQQPLSLRQTQAFWYQWFFNTQQGYTRLKEERKALCYYLWQSWSPSWQFSPEEFDTTAASWDNPDFVDIVTHAYRHRWKNAEGDPQYAQMEEQLKQSPNIDVPVIFLQGDQDGASLPESSLNKEKFFGSHYERRVVAGAGHFIQRENPGAVVQAIEDMLALVSHV